MNKKEIQRKLNAFTTSQTQNFAVQNELISEAQRNKQSAYWLVKFTRHQLWAKNSLVCLHSLYLFLNLMKKPQGAILYEMNRKGVAEIEKLYLKKVKIRGMSSTDRQICKTCVNLICEWNMLYGNQRKIPQFNKSYNNLRKKGVKFNARPKPNINKPRFN
eukprot:UN29832